MTAKAADIDRCILGIKKVWTNETPKKFNRDLVLAMACVLLKEYKYMLQERRER